MILILTTIVFSLDFNAKLQILGLIYLLKICTYWDDWF